MFLFDFSRFEMEDVHPLPTVLVSSMLKQKLDIHHDQNDENDTRRKAKRRGIFQLDPGN